MKTGLVHLNEEKVQRWSRPWDIFTFIATYETSSQSYLGQGVQTGAHKKVSLPFIVQPHSQSLLCFFPASRGTIACASASGMAGSNVVEAEMAARER